MVVYKHKKNNDDTVFYIGIGNSKRPSCIKDRNFHWTNVANKYGFYSEIVFSGLTKEEAVKAEIWLISIYGRIDLGTGVLVNMTDGGDGVRNWIPDGNWKYKQRIAKVGVERPEDVKRKISETKKGVSNYKLKGENHFFYGKSRPDISYRMSKAIINKDTKEVIVGVKSLSVKTGVKYSTLVSWLNKSNNPPEWFIWEYYKNTNNEEKTK